VGKEPGMISIVELDKSVFTWINAGWSNPVFDIIMPLITRMADPLAMWLWIFFLALLAYRKSEDLNLPDFGKERLATAIKTYLLYYLYLALIIGVNAWICKSLKAIVGRARPFIVQETVIRLSPCSMADLNHFSSFPSGHAVNAFMIAVILSQIFRKQRFVFYLMALLVALSRVYVGVHYPLDVTAGACLGTAVTLLMLAFLFNRGKFIKLFTSK